MHGVQLLEKTILAVRELTFVDQLTLFPGTHFIKPAVTAMLTQASRYAGANCSYIIAVLFVQLVQQAILLHGPQPLRKRWIYDVDPTAATVFASAPGYFGADRHPYIAVIAAQALQKMILHRCPRSHFRGWVVQEVTSMVARCSRAPRKAFADFLPRTPVFSM